jgi:hypothetical protein
MVHMFSLINLAAAAFLGFVSLFDQKRSRTWEKIGYGLFSMAILGLLLYPLTPRGSWKDAILAFLACLLPLYRFFHPNSVSLLPMGSGIFLAFFWGYFFEQTPKSLFSFHILGAFMGELAGLCAGLIAIMLLWKQRALKKKHMDEVFSSPIPSLNILENILLTSLWTGFFFLSITLISGLVTWAMEDNTEKLWQNTKILWAFFVWSWYLIILVCRMIKKLSMRYIAILSLWGLVWLMFVILSRPYGV